jgi:hypothetical protein
MSVLFLFGMVVDSTILSVTMTARKAEPVRIEVLDCLTYKED